MLAIDITIFSAFAGSFLLAWNAIRSFQKPDQVAKTKLRRRPECQLRNQANVDASTKFDLWFLKVISRAGLAIDRVTALALILATSLAGVGVAFVMECHPFIQIAIGLGIFAAGFGGYYFVMVRRIRAFTRQFPTALELLARATRAGESLEAAFEVTIQSSEKPVSDEFGICVKHLKLGLSPQNVVRELADRIGTPDIHLFAHTIEIHQSTGGKLADSLEKLSTVIRDRTECTEKLRSMTSIGRFTVFAILGIGIFGLSYLVMTQPEYVGKLSKSDLGKKLIAYAVVSEFIGLFWICWTLKSDL